RICPIRARHPNSMMFLLKRSSLLLPETAGEKNFCRGLRPRMTPESLIARRCGSMPHRRAIKLTCELEIPVAEIDLEERRRLIVDILRHCEQECWLVQRNERHILI